MVLFPCTSFTRLSSILLTAAVAFCAADVRATKIEFSVAASEIEVPDLQKELKADAKFTLRSEVDFKGASSLPQMAPPVVILNPGRDQDRDPFSVKDKYKDTDKNRIDRNPTSFQSNDADPAKRNAMLAEQYKAMNKPADQLKNDDSLSGSSWQVNRKASERESDSAYNSHERNVGWSTLFKDAQDERDRREQSSRLTGFRALYETPNSMAPIGTPAPNSDPVKDSLWHEPGINPHDGRTELMSRRDDPQYNQQLPGSRGSSTDTFDAGPTRSEASRNQMEPVRQFDQHRGVLEMPHRPGDIFNR
ncbi:MAG: hypothetical protein JWO95_2017 [Verrucomicrobiales bacterium]|nr:hypothetical protein [Verrucomicrobiales bacterium]